MATPFRILSLLAMLLALLLVSPPAAADYFGRPAGSGGQPAATPPAVTLPAPLAGALRAVVSLQSELNARLRAALAEARSRNSWQPAMAIMLLSFLYGVFHAAGPGHGKAVLGSYFLTRRARILHGLGASFLSATVQALSAILLVGLLVAVFDVSARRILDHAGALEMASYGAVALIGLWMVWGIASGRHHCHHPGHGHNHGHDHPHDHGHQHPAEAPRAPLMMTSIAVGLRPCSGAILVLLFTLTNGMLLTGIASTFAMAAGVALTVSAVTLASLGLQRSAGLFGGRVAALAGRLYRGLALAGALFIALFGAAQLVALWTGAITPLGG